MISTEIDKYIMEAMKSHNEIRTAVMRMIKTKFMEYRTSKGAKPIDENVEITLLRKMVAEREDAAEQYMAAGRTGLAENERQEAEIIKEFLPAPISEETIRQEIEYHINRGLEPVMKNMGVFIRAIKEKYPTADGSVLSRIVKSTLK